MAVPTESLLHAHLGTMRRRWVAGAVTAASVIAILAPVAIGLPNLYRSSASLMVDQAFDPLSQANTQTLEINARLQAIRQEALIRQRALDFAEQFDLYPEQRQAGQSDLLVAMMQRDVRVEQTSTSRGDGRSTTVSFSVRYTGVDPQKVARFANRLAQFYVERNGEMRSQLASRASEQLKQELDTLRARLDAQDRRVSDYTTQNAGTLPAQLTTITTRHGQLTTQYQTNNGEITRLTERREGVQSQIAGLSTPSAGADLADPNVRLAQATRELQNLLARYEERSFEVRSKRNEIAGLQAQVAAAAKGAANGTPAGLSMLATLQAQVVEQDKRINTLRATNASLQTELEKLDAILAAAPLRNAEFDRLSREAAQTRTQYEALHLRYQTALSGERVQQGTSGTEFQVLDPAVAAELPSAPDRRLLLAIAVLLAIGLGVGVMLLLDRLDRSFRSVDELRAFTHVPVLATIPRIVSRRASARRLVLVSVAGAAVSVALAFISVGVFHFAQQAEPITRMLLR